MANANMTTSVQYIVDQLRLHTKLQNFLGIGGVSNEPGLSICTRVNQKLLTRRMPWKFNRALLDGPPRSYAGNFMVSQQGMQDVQFAGATLFVLLNSTFGAAALPAGGVSIDLAPGIIVQQGAATQVYGPVNSPAGAGLIYSGGTILVQTIDPHPFQAANVGQSTMYITGAMNPAFNSVFTYNQLTQTSQWTQGYLLLSVVDKNHLVLAQNGGQSASPITAIAVSGTITTLTVANTLSANDIMNIAGMTTNTALNGQSVTLTATTATTVSFTTPTGVTVTPGAETGNLTATNSGAPGLFHFGWMESASLTDINSVAFPQPVRPIKAVRLIAPEYTTTGDQYSMCALIDYNNGVIKFRLSEPTSSYAFQFNCAYQLRAPKLNNPQQLIQWPDDYVFAFVELALWEGMRFAYGVGSEESKLQMEMAALALTEVMQSEDREDSSQALTPDFTLMDSY